MNKESRDILVCMLTALVGLITLLTLVFMIVGCTVVDWKAQDGTHLTGYSFLSNKTVAGSLSDDGKTRTLVINDLTEDQTTGAAAMVGAAVEAAVKGMKP